MLCSITDKRSLIRTGHAFHDTYSSPTQKIEKEFQTMILKTKFFYSRNFTGFSNPLYKFTIELVYDNYDLPERYIVPENRIIHQYKKIYYRAGCISGLLPQFLDPPLRGCRGNLNMISRFLSLKRTSFVNNNACYAMRGAANMVINMC